MSRSGRERAPTGSAHSLPSATVRSLLLRHCAFPAWRWSGAEQSAAGLSLLLLATLWSRRRVGHLSPPLLAAPPHAPRTIRQSPTARDALPSTALVHPKHGRLLPPPTQYCS